METSPKPTNTDKPDYWARLVAPLVLALASISFQLGREDGSTPDSSNNKPVPNAKADQNNGLGTMLRLSELFPTLKETLSKIDLNTTPGSTQAKELAGALSELKDALLYNLKNNKDAPTLDLSITELIDALKGGKNDYQDIPLERRISFVTDTIDLFYREADPQAK
jgi:hypothetical protein